jgi:hypothetical protein
MAVPGAANQIHAAVTEWPGVESHPHRFGGTEYRLGRREIGHIHGDSLVDIPFPKRVRDEVVAEGRAAPHHVLPESGWVSCYLAAPADVSRAIDLLRLSFDLAVKQKAAVPAAAVPAAAVPATAVPATATPASAAPGSAAP